jgi:hypothetical protein
VFVNGYYCIIILCRSVQTLAVMPPPAPSEQGHSALTEIAARRTASLGPWAPSVGQPPSSVTLLNSASEIPPTALQISTSRTAPLATKDQTSATLESAKHWMLNVRGSLVSV